MNSFRPLLIFWAVLLALLGAGAAYLQVTFPSASLARPGNAPRRIAAAAPQAAPTRAAPAPLPLPAAPAASGAPIAEPDASLLENATDLPGNVLPRIADDGRTPAQAYAAEFDPGERHPRIALLIDGIGLDRALSEQAISTLPSAIDIAFSAYAPALVALKLASEARHQGRECLVSIPMEPSGFPVTEEGDRSLLIGASPSQNRVDLELALTTVQGCVGATAASDGMAGERFAESRQSFAEMLQALDRRGLLYLDPRPGAPPPDSAADKPLPRVADVVVDRAPSADEPANAQAIDKGLATLERIAAERGSAIGIAGPPRSVLLERISVWANGLAARGMVLAPLTAIAPPRRPNPSEPSQ